MAEHESSIGGSDDWYTPPEIFTAIGLMFDLDPCSPGANHWVPALRVYTKAEDGLAQPWHGLVFMNPPFGGRNGHVPWLEKFFAHGNGIAVVRAYTSSEWFHETLVPRAEALLFPKGKTRFIPSDEVRRRLELKAASKEKVWRNAPGHGVVLVAMGGVAINALRKSELGLFIDRRRERAAEIEEARQILHGLFRAEVHVEGCLFKADQRMPCQCGASDRYADLKRRTFKFLDSRPKATG